MHFERANSLRQARQIFEDELSKLNLSCKLSFTGSHPRTTRCVLLHANNVIADVGNGKGIGLQSEISARYEALEHYVSTQKSLLQNQCLALAFDKIEKGLSFSNKELLPLVFKNTCKTKTTPWVSLKGFNQNSSILLPYFLVNPDYSKQTFSYDEIDYSTLSEVATNNGTAIGTTFDEAMLHGINELIERDAISCFLLATFGKKTPQPIKLVCKFSLPASIAQIIAKIEQDYEEELLVIDISTDLNIPVFLVSFTKQNQYIQPMGFGSSLSALYAIERAVLEALQSFHLYNEGLKREDEQILMRFNKWPKLHQCAQSDVSSIISLGMFEQTEFHDLKRPSGIDSALQETIRILKHKEFYIFYAIHYQSESGITCVKVVIPGVEQFHRVRYGSFAIPGKRGQKVILT